MRQPKVVFEDEYLLVVNKPTGMVVNRAETVKGETLQDWVDSYAKELNAIAAVPLSDCRVVRPACRQGRPDARKRSKDTQTILNDFSLRNGIVHRLDKETSGVMVVAKTEEVMNELQRQFKEREVEKVYVALVHGKLEPKEGWFTLPLSRSQKDRKKFSVSLGGKKSKTGYKVLEYFGALRFSKTSRGSQRYSLVEAYPKTGRTHQIRVVFKHLNHPIASDSKYLGKRRLKADLEWCPRLFLHAKKLRFIHPKIEERVEFEADLAEDLRGALKHLK